MGGSLADLGVLDAAAKLRAGDVSAVELLEACEARIAERNGGEPSFDGAPDAVNAWARLYPERALEAARAADERLAREGDAAPLLCGIPIGVKDLYGVAGLPLTASSRVLEGTVADEDAVAWARLRDRGMVIVGHTHTHEFAAGGTTDQVGNPWDVSRSAGGSSGGSGAALAAGMVPAALGTDTAGSLRIPAALSGVSSIKADARPGADRRHRPAVGDARPRRAHGALDRRLRRGAERDGGGRRAGHAADAPAGAARRPADGTARRRAAARGAARGAHRPRRGAGRGGRRDGRPRGRAPRLRGARRERRVPARRGRPRDERLQRGDVLGGGASITRATPS